LRLKSIIQNHAPSDFKFIAPHAENIIKKTRTTSKNIAQTFKSSYPSAYAGYDH